MTTLLEARDLGFETPSGACLVDGISMEVPSGSTVAIIGPNGAGKTTLLHMLAGFLRPSHGEVFISGVSMRRLSARNRARTIAILGQVSEPDRRLTVLDYVGFGRIPHAGTLSKPDDEKIVRRVLEEVGVGQLATHKIGEISGGERQRVFLARALAQQPDLLLLDEPTNHLDPRARFELLSLVRDLGVTTIAALHDLAQVAPFASHVAVMSGGRLNAFGAPAGVMTAELVSAVFHIDVFRIPHPSTGASTFFFDNPPLTRSNPGGVP